MTETILIANAKPEETSALREGLARYFHPVPIKAADEFDRDESYDLILIDENFTDFNGIDFLMTAISSSPAPAILMLDYEHSDHAAEAMNVGAFNYIIKTKDHVDTVIFSVKEALKRSQALKEKDETIRNLKEKIKELESRAGMDQFRRTVQQKREEKQAQQHPQETSTIQDIVTALKKEEILVPTHPRISSRLNSLTSANGLKNLLVKEGDINTKLVEIAESDRYKTRVPAKTVEEAINRIGVPQTINFIQLCAYKPLFVAETDKYAPLVQQLWRHSVTCAYTCQEISKELLMKDPAQMFIMGLMHDIGKLLLVKIMEYLETRPPYQETGIDMDEATDILNTYHGKFGSALMKRWDMPAEYSQITQYQANILQASSTTIEILMVSLAREIAKSLETGNRDPKLTSMTKPASELKVNAETIDLITGKVEQTIWVNDFI